MILSRRATSQFPSSGWECEAPARPFFVVPRYGGGKRQAQTYGDAVDDWRGNGACVVFTPVMDRHQRKDGHRPAASVCHAVSINVVKHDGANAKPCDSMRNGMKRHGMAEKVGKGGKGSGAKRQAKTYGDAVDDWRGNGACVVFTPVMDRHQRKDGHRPAASVCHAVSINVVKHDGANAKPCDSMRNGMERHGMADK